MDYGSRTPLQKQLLKEALECKEHDLSLWREIREEEKALRIAILGEKAANTFRPFDELPPGQLRDAAVEELLRYKEWLTSVWPGIYPQIRIPLCQKRWLEILRSYRSPPTPNVITFAPQQHGHKLTHVHKPPPNGFMMRKAA